MLPFVGGAVKEDFPEEGPPKMNLQGFTRCKELVFI